MKNLILSAVLITISGLVSSTHAQQQNDVPDGWTKITVCGLSFFAPPDMKDGGVGGVDSCIALFVNKDITLYLDYGRYGSAPQKDKSDPESKEESISIDGKNAQLVTSVDASQSYPARKYKAFIYVMVKESKLEGLPKIISLMMSVLGQGQKDQETAKRIFRTIRFEEHPE